MIGMMERGGPDTAFTVFKLDEVRRVYTHNNYGNGSDAVDVKCEFRHKRDNRDSMDRSDASPLASDLPRAEAERLVFWLAACFKDTRAPAQSEMARLSERVNAQ